MSSAQGGSELLVAVGDDNGFTFESASDLGTSPQETWENPFWSTSTDVGGFPILSPNLLTFSPFIASVEIRYEGTCSLSASNVVIQITPETIQRISFALVTQPGLKWYRSAVTAVQAGTSITAPAQQTTVAMLHTAPTRTRSCGLVPPRESYVPSTRAPSQR